MAANAAAVTISGASQPRRVLSFSSAARIISPTPAGIADARQALETSSDIIDTIASLSA